MDGKAFSRTGAVAPVAFGARLAGSDAFKDMFKEGMTLVELTAAYLDGDGRKESRLLARSASLTYAAESMRLTTRLMQLASWLLLQRSVNSGDMTQGDANRERAKVKLGGLSTATDGAGWDSLPERLQELINRSLSLEQRIITLNDALTGVPVEPAPNAVQRDLGRLAAAFAR